MADFVYHEEVIRLVKAEHHLLARRVRGLRNKRAHEIGDSMIAPYMEACDDILAEIERMGA